MRIIAFVLDPPAILPAQSPPQTELEFNQDGDGDDWPEMDQSAGASGDLWD